MNKNTVTCETLAHMGALIAVFVAEGLTFEASTEQMTITLTGGH